MVTLLSLGNLCVLVAAAARLLDAAAVDGHDDHEHGGEDAGHDGPVHCSGADDNYIISGSLSLYLPDDDEMTTDTPMVVLHLEPLLHRVLGRHHAQGQVGPRLGRPGHRHHHCCHKYIGTGR